MLRRPLPAFVGLTVADYLAWSWSAAHGPRIVALFCGLVLTLLILAVVWMLLASLVRFLVDRSLLSRRVVIRHGVALGNAMRSAVPAAAGAAQRRGAAYTVRRMRIRRRPARRMAHQPEHAARESGHVAHGERVAAERIAA